MPRFSHAVLASLKRAMLPRAGSCFFTPEDVEQVVEETGLDRSSVTQWAEFLRWRVKNGMIADVEAFLRSSSDSAPSQGVFLKRCYISMYNAEEDKIRTFSFQRSRVAREVPISFTQFALDEKTGLVEGFMEFQEQVWSHRLQAQWEQIGNSSISIQTFQMNDGNYSAASALNRVTKLASTQGFKLITTGVGNPKLLAKAKQLLLSDSAKCCPNCGVCVSMFFPPNQVTNTQTLNDEYDIVKKRKVVQKVFELEAEIDASDTDILGQICDFSEAMSSALDTVSVRDAEILKEELDWLHMNNILPIKVNFGYVYIAWNPCFDELVKIGATMKDNPFERIKQLSGTSVPKSFELIACIPCTDPFALEKKVHIHFKSMRIQKNGMNTEFFKVDRETASRYLNSLVSL